MQGVIRLRYKQYISLICSVVQYEIFYILPITIIAHQICHDTIIIMIYNLSPV